MDELNVYDVEFLYGCINPTIIVIHKDNDGRHVKTHEINLREKEFTKIAWKQDNVETEATMLIPVPTPLGKYILKKLLLHILQIIHFRWRHCHRPRVNCLS